MSHPPITGASTLGLCPFTVRGRGDHYSVISRQDRQAISTSKAGVAAIRLLAAGRSIGDARRVLGQAYGHPADEIDLAPLLATLFASGFVQRLDGRPIAPAPAPAKHRLRAWVTLLVWSPLLGLAIRHLPLRWAVPLAYRWFSLTPNPELERRIAANVRCARELHYTDEGIARIATSHRQALRKQFCDRLLLGSLPPRRARRWLGREIQVTGLEHLARSVASGKGTTLCSFHMGSYGLLPFVLGARGVVLTMYVGFGQAVRTDVAAQLAERARRGDAYPIRIAGGTMGLRVLVRCLAQGGTVLLYCDRPPGEAGRADHGRAGISVPFLGTRVWSAPGVGWLHRRTGAAVLPAVLLWEGRRGHHLHIAPEMGADRGPGGVADVGGVMAAAYGALERWVRCQPAQWLKWEDFGGMIAPSQTGELSDSLCT
jgi:lauroyl/myristoyl acyltransferase